MQYPGHNQLLFVKSNHKLIGPVSGDLYKFANPVVAKRKKRILAELVEAGGGVWCCIRNQIHIRTLSTRTHVGA